jgi:hypothetical protein
MNNIKQFVFGAVAVLFVFLLVTVYNLNNKVKELDTKIKSSTQVVIKQKSSSDEMFNNFFDLVVKLKELENQSERERRDDSNNPVSKN